MDGRSLRNRKNNMFLAVHYNFSIRKRISRVYIDLIRLGCQFDCTRKEYGIYNPLVYQKKNVCIKRESERGSVSQNERVGCIVCINFEHQFDSERIIENG